LDTRKLSESKKKEFIKELKESPEIELAYREKYVIDPLTNSMVNPYSSSKK